MNNFKKFFAVWIFLSSSGPLFAKNSQDCSRDLGFVVALKKTIILKPIPELEWEVDKVLEIFEYPFKNVGLAQIQRIRALENLAALLKTHGFEVRVIKNSREFVELWKKKNPAFKSASQDENFLEAFLGQYQSEMPLLEFGPRENKKFYQLLLKYIPSKFLDDLNSAEPSFFWSPNSNKNAAANFFYDPGTAGFRFISVSPDALKTLTTTPLEFHEFDHFWIYQRVNNGHQTPFSWSFSSHYLKRVAQRRENNSKSFLPKPILNKFGAPATRWKMYDQILRVYLGDQAFDEIFTHSRDFLRSLALKFQNPRKGPDQEYGTIDLFMAVSFLQRSLSEIESCLRAIGGRPSDFKLIKETEDSLGNTFGVGEFVNKQGRKFKISVENIKTENTSPSNLAVVTVLYNLSQPKNLSSILNVKTLETGDSQLIFFEAHQNTKSNLYKTHQKLEKLLQDIVALNLTEISSRWSEFSKPENLKFYKNIYEKLSMALGESFEL